MPSGVWIVAVITAPVFTLWMRTRVVGLCAVTRPVSIAYGPTAASMLPQFGLKSTTALSTEHWANR